MTRVTRPDTGHGSPGRAIRVSLDVTSFSAVEAGHFTWTAQAREHSDDTDPPPSFPALRAGRRARRRHARHRLSLPLLGAEARRPDAAHLPVGRRGPSRKGQLRGRCGDGGGRWPILWQRPVLCGAGYGLLLYAIMNYVVVPLSAAGPGSKDPLWIGLSVAVHAVLIGIPIALFTRRAQQE